MVCFIIGSELGLAASLLSGDGERDTDRALYRLGGVLDLGRVRLGRYSYYDDTVLLPVVPDVAGEA